MANAQPHLQLLQEGAKQLGVALSPETLVQFSLYLEELILWSAKIDLVSQTDRLTIIRKHFLDSLAVIPHLLEAKTILDLGSGAGFPGMPLAVSLAHTSVTLVETKRKRVNFLKQVARKIKARNLTVLEGRAEVLAKEGLLQNHFDVVVTRATWSIATFFDLAYPFVCDEGKIIAMRGPQKNAEIFSSQIDKDKCQVVGFYEYTLPLGDEQRSLLVFGKNVSRDT